MVDRRKEKVTGTCPNCRCEPVTKKEPDFAVVKEFIDEMGDLITYYKYNTVADSHSIIYSTDDIYCSNVHKRGLDEVVLDFSVNIKGTSKEIAKKVKAVISALEKS